MAWTLEYNIQQYTGEKANGSMTAQLLGRRDGGNADNACSFDL